MSAIIKLMSTSEETFCIVLLSNSYVLRHKAASVTIFQIKDWIKIIKEFPWSVLIYLDCELCVETENAENFSGDKLKKILRY